MHVGNINQWEREIPYLSDLVAPWICKLAGLDVTTLTTGRHDLGAPHFMNVDEGMTGPKEERPMEAHHYYADIQYVISGEEDIGYQPMCNVTDLIKSDEEHDGFLYNADCALDSVIHMVPGTFAIFMPGDAHRCLCAPDGKAAPIKKLIMKIYLG